MNDNQVIKKLQILKSFEADAATLRLIRKQISSPGSVTNRFSFKKWFAVKPLVPVLAMAVILLIFVVLVSFPQNFIENAFVSARITLAPNHYEKAKIALANVQYKVNSFQKNSSNSGTIKELSRSLAFANQTMSGLQLVGEKGKYSSYQCKELYESYHKDLYIIENTVDKSSKPDIKTLGLQAEQYDQQALIKLENYKDNKWQNSGKK